MPNWEKISHLAFLLQGLMASFVTTGRTLKWGGHHGQWPRCLG
jgi:hypothetical protein